MNIRISSTIRERLPQDKEFWSKLKFHIQDKTFDEPSLAGWIMEQITGKKKFTSKEFSANDLDTIEDFTKELLKLQNSEKKIDLQFEQLRALMRYEKEKKVFCEKQEPTLECERCTDPDDCIYDRMKAEEMDRINKKSASGLLDVLHSGRVE